jgi:molecular chaperone DnaK
MAADNKTLGRFELTGIAPAPRGTPQIEVTFDIDANGIVNVAAKDQATGKEQSIRITASSGLDKDEIDRLVREAEMNADADRRKKNLVDARNEADGLVYTTEKTLTEMGGQLDDASKGLVQNAIQALKTAMQGENVEEIRRLSEDLKRVSQQMAASAYQQQQAGGGASPGAQAHQSERERKDDVVDAEFEEVN